MPFDLGRLEVTGTPVPVLESVVTKVSGAANFAVARDGSLVYLAGFLRGAERTLAWVDRMGREQALQTPTRAYEYARVSPDGTRIALAMTDQEDDIWTWDLARQTLTRLTFGPGVDSYPVWTPEGRRILFSSGGVQNLFWQSADGTGTAERLTESPNSQVPNAVTPDGTSVVFREITATGHDVMLIPLQPPRRPQPLIQTMFQERNAETSPDGRWIAYESGESGRAEIYVRPFPEVGGGRWQVSTEGGRTPVWSRKGGELFFLSTEGFVMGARIETGSSWRSDTPRRVLQNQYYQSLPAAGRTWDVAPDGRLLMIKNSGTDTATEPQNRLFLVQHWTEELKRLVPAS